MPEQPKKEFRNDSGLEFKDISSEKYRTYHFKSGNVKTIFNCGCMYLNVSKNGHRVFDGIRSHYIFLENVESIDWEVSEGLPHFVK